MTARSLPRLLLVTDRHRTAGRPLVDVVGSAVDAGARFVQVRERDLDDAALGALLDALVRRVPAETRIVVNGSPAVARGRDVGLHLPEGVRKTEVREVSFWGRSAHDRRGLDAALSEGAAYAILGTLFPTPSKPGHAGRGIEWLRGILTPRIGIPVFAIGGIDASRAAGVRAAGAHGAAVCGAILSAPDPAAATARLLESLGPD